MTNENYFRQTDNFMEGLIGIIVLGLICYAIVSIYATYYSSRVRRGPRGGKYKENFWTGKKTYVGDPGCVLL